MTNQATPNAERFEGCRYCEGTGAVAEGYDPNTGQTWSSSGAAVRHWESTAACGDDYEHPTCIGCEDLIEAGDAALVGAYCGRWYGLHARLDCLESSMTHGYERVDADEIAALVMHVVHTLLRRERRGTARDAD